MKKIIAIVCFMITAQSLLSQININLTLAGRPPARLSDWANRRDVLTLIMGSSQTVRFDVKIKAEIKTLDGTVIGTTNLNTAKAYTPLAGASTILNALDVLPLENIVFTGKYQTALVKTGKLPADNYMLCVQLVRVPDYAPASAVTCKTFYLAAYQLPTLMLPSNEQELNKSIAQSAITFRWTPVVPASTTAVTYRLLVFEILDNQKDVQALRSNQPLLDKNIVGTTQFIWQPQLSMMPYTNETDSLTTTQRKGWDGTVKGGNISSERKGWDGTVKGKKFIWTIQTLDNLGQPLNQTDGNGESMSEPKVFFVLDKNIAGKKKE
jgi:hypothetical protein